MTTKDLYPSFQNPYLIQPTRAIPEEMAVLGAGHIGPDIAYSFRLAFPEKKLYLVEHSNGLKATHKKG
jgi:enoyl-CoA hydratase/3-hydroxyacyl-CoA dehydrogenase